MRTKMTGSRIAAFMILLLGAMLLGCAQSWEPSDKEAVELVRSYYLFYNNGEAVQAEVVKRGELIEVCDCYPITFKIVFSSGRENNKTFYFYRDKNGGVKVKEIMGTITS